MKKILAKIPNFFKNIINWNFKSLLINFYIIILLVLLVCGISDQTILKIVIWPSLITAFMINFKDQLSNLVNRIRGVKITGVEELQMQAIKSEIDPSNIVAIIVEQYSHLIIQKESEIEQKKLAEDKLVQEIAVQAILIHFERVFNRILPSQIRLLGIFWDFQAKNTAGIGCLELEYYFNNLKSSIPEYSNFTWENYIIFLIQQGLIHKHENGNFVITECGNVFLQYITSMNYQKFGDF